MSKKKNNKKEYKMKKEDQNSEKEEMMAAEDKEQTETAVKGKSTEEMVPSAEELLVKIDELNDKYLRLYSEFDNYRKRTQKERIELGKYASEQMIVDLLPVLDDFERALESAKAIENCDPVKEGMGLIYNKFISILEKKGLKPIESIGTAFDTDYHEAVTFIPSPSDELKGKVVDELAKGYMLQDKVIRYTKVVIGQ